MRPFAPQPAKTVTISVTNSNAATLINPDKSALTMRLYNAGPAIAFVKPGDANAVADSAKDMPIPEGKRVEPFDPQKHVWPPAEG